MRVKLGVLIAGLLNSAAAALAQGAGEPAQAPPPVPGARMTWPGVVIILILALFLCAAIAGPLIRANTRDELD